MKIVIVSSSLFLSISLFSCTQDYICECESVTVSGKDTLSSVTKTTIREVTELRAVQECADKSTTFSLNGTKTSVSCELH